MPQLKPDDFTIPFHQQNSPKITSKKSSYLPTITCSGRLLRLVKIPIFLDFTDYAGTACQKIPLKKLEKWLDFFWSSPPWVIK